MRATGILVAGVGVAALSLSAALLWGSAPLSVHEVWRGLTDANAGAARDIVWHLRAPRALAAFACGGLLALAGVLLQALLRNALADSYILGVSGGASLGALAATMLGLGLASLHTAALAGAVAAIAIVFGVTFRGGQWNIYRLLLSGVVLSAGFAALTSLILVLSPAAQIKGMLFWLMGDLSYAGNPWFAAMLLIALTLGAAALAPRLDILGLGETKARSLGVGVAALQLTVFFSAALATTAAVMLGGAIGFVGLMMPHAVRLLGVTRHRLLAPMAVLAGGSFLTIADTCARTLWAPQQLPVGIFTALIGVPCMLYLLTRRA
ncbi:MAG: iron ABC transporter permease [Betaproteobacteria bacterium]|nr:iron ABC transporter permease [Betaproteobacteria bacterium]